MQRTRNGTSKLVLHARSTMDVNHFLFVQNSHFCVNNVYLQQYVHGLVFFPGLFHRTYSQGVGMRAVKVDRSRNMINIAVND